MAAFWREVGAAGNPQPVIRAWLQRGERIPGFGHVLYRQQGDPNGGAAGHLRASYGASQRWHWPTASSSRQTR
ncbi:MAG: hypothetical protein IPK17_37355 [Chloroflexi bacterium]|uniref:hypothetical protein n=1 Tax=Candidatus Flexifilum breve TaxID=3140694 RepID=UPI0031352EF4|nr:hypothetical protein [Chloroflexota bacterium]